MLGYSLFTRFPMSSPFAYHPVLKTSSTYCQTTLPFHSTPSPPHSTPLHFLPPLLNPSPFRLHPTVLHTRLRQ